MKNVLQFLWKRNFLILFLILESYAISFILNNNDFHRVTFNSSANDITGIIYNEYTDLTSFLYLKNTNALLAKENADLKNQLSSFLEYDPTITKTKYDSAYKQQYTYTEAKVINKTVNKANNYLTLNKGYKDGIRSEMAVTSSEGIVGIVKNVTPNYSSVLSLLHGKIKVSAQIKKNGYFGTMSWQTHNSKQMTLNDIPSHVKLQVGDSIITSGYSTIFPDGIPIGRIIKFKKDDSGSFHNITVELFTSFRKLEHVYVIGNLRKKEQDNLESQNKVIEHVE